MLSTLKHALNAAEYMRQPEPPPPEMDKNLIKAAIVAGVVAAGAILVKSDRLEIK